MQSYKRLRRFHVTFIIHRQYDVYTLFCLSLLDILYCSSPISRDDYQLPTRVAQTLFPNDRAVIWNVCNQPAIGCTVVSIGSTAAMRCWVVTPTKIKSIFQFSSGYDVKPPRPPESEIPPYVIALPILRRRNRGYNRNDNIANDLSLACTLRLAIFRDSK